MVLRFLKVIKKLKESEINSISFFNNDIDNITIKIDNIKRKILDEKREELINAIKSDLCDEGQKHLISIIDYDLESISNYEKNYLF